MKWIEMILQIKITNNLVTMLLNNIIICYSKEIFLIFSKNFENVTTR